MVFPEPFCKSPDGAVELWKLLVLPNPKKFWEDKGGREDGEEQLRYWQITVLVQWLVSVCMQTHAL